jgi:putative ABC transport system substrate-binding protein
MRALAAAPHVGAAIQQSGRVYRVGVLYPGGLPPLSPAGREFRQALREFGFVEGENMVFERRGAEGQYDRLPALASELVRLNTDVIVAITPRSVQAAKQATTTIPIVMYAVSDPENEALVASLARPGGNVTGVAHLSFEIASKMLQMIRELLPHAKRVVQFTDGPNSRLRESAGRLGLSLDVVSVTGNKGVESFFDNMHERKAERPDAVWFSAIALSGSLVAGPHLQLAIRHRIPDFGA